MDENIDDLHSINVKNHDLEVRPNVQPVRERVELNNWDISEVREEDNLAPKN